ncbi:hypothetical protein CBL_05135 [Carabus blaptoides fortunei]
MTEIKEQVLIGLWSRELCNMVAGKQHNDQDALLHDLLQFDELNRVRRERFKTQRPNEKSNMQKPQEQNSTTHPVRESNSDGKQKSVVRNEKRKVKCYNCNVSGHLSRDCPKPKLPIRCFKYNEEGHVSRQCSKNLVMQVVNNDNCALKFIKSVKLNDATVASSMFDTGATVCTIRKSVAQRAEFSPESLEKPIVLTGFGVDNIDLIIVPDESQQTEIIIGRTFTEKEEIAYIRIGNKLKFGYCWDAPFKEIDLEADTVKGQDPINRMAEKTQNHDNLVVTKQETCHCNTMCLISAKLNVVDEEVVVPVMNVGNKNIEVCKGQVLGRNVKILNSSMGHETTNDRSESVITSDEVKTGEKNINELGCTTVTKMDIVEKKACEHESESSEDEEVNQLPSTEAAEGCEEDQVKKRDELNPGLAQEGRGQPSEVVDAPLCFNIIADTLSRNGYRMRDNQSKVVIEWLIWEEKTRQIRIEQAARGRDGNPKVDGYYDPETLVFEFSVRSHGRENKTKLRELGYTVIEKWKCDFAKDKRRDRKLRDFGSNHALLNTIPLEPRDAFFAGRTGNCTLHHKAGKDEKIKYVEVWSLYP